MISIEKLTRVFFLDMKKQSVLILEDSSRLKIDSDEEPKIKQSLKKWTKTDKTGKFESYDES